MTKKQEKTAKKTDNKKDNKTIFIILGIVGVLGLFAIISIIVSSQTAAPTQNQEEENPQMSTEVVATVNEQEIYEEEVLAIQREFSQTQENMSYEDALNQAVMVTVLRQELQSSNATLSLEQTQNVLTQQLQAQGNSLEDFKSQVESQGQSFENILQNYQFQFSIQQFLEGKTGNVTVTQQEIEEYYNLYSQQAQGQEVPELEQISDQIEQSIKEEKLSQLQNQYITSLVEEANVEYS